MNHQPKTEKAREDYNALKAAIRCVWGRTEPTEKMEDDDLAAIARRCGAIRIADADEIWRNRTKQA